MRKKLTLFLIILINAAIFTSCENKEPIHCVLNQTTISSNSPAFTGDEIQLSTLTYSSTGTVIYEWNGPNGFQSFQQNPVIPNATTAMAGDYTLKVKIGICETEELKTTVEVIPNTVTCTQTNNTATITNGSYPNANFYSFNSYQVVNNEYLLSGGDLRWSIRAYFLADTSPITGTYSIVGSSTTLTSTTVRVEATYTTLSGSTFEYIAKPGDVSVSYVNGFAVVKFCDVPFSSTTSTSTQFNCSAKYTQD